MNNQLDREYIVKRLSNYCSRCKGQCCREGVFSVFDWEAKELSLYDKNFCNCHISEIRGKTQDIAIKEKCIFLKKNGCKLPVKLRPIDCISFPFYPKLQENNGKLKIDYLAVSKKCPFSDKIAKDNKLVKIVDSYWTGLIKDIPSQKIVDWIGKGKDCDEWYKNSLRVIVKK